MARAERSQCVEKAKHIGDRRLLAHTVVRPCPAIIGGEESCKTSSSAGPWCWPRPRHRGQRIPTVPSRIGPVEVDFVLVRHFLGGFFRPLSKHLHLRAGIEPAGKSISWGVVFFQIDSISGRG